MVGMPNRGIFHRSGRGWNLSEMRGSGIAVSGMGAEKVIPPWRIDNPRHRVFPPCMADVSGLATIPLLFREATADLSCAGRRARRVHQRLCDQVAEP
jgi:hypothetical protein